MAAYYIGTYDIVDPNEFQKYPPVVLSLLPKYGGEVLASDTSALRGRGDCPHDERDHSLSVEGRCARAVQRPCLSGSEAHPAGVNEERQHGACGRIPPTLRSRVVEAANEARTAPLGGREARQRESSCRAPVATEWTAARR